MKLEESVCIHCDNPLEDPHELWCPGCNDFICDMCEAGLLPDLRARQCLECENRFAGATRYFDRAGWKERVIEFFVCPDSCINRPATGGWHMFISATYLGHATPVDKDSVHSWLHLVDNYPPVEALYEDEYLVEASYEDCDLVEAIRRGVSEMGSSA